MGRLFPHQIEHIRALRAEGLYLREIASLCGVCVPTVQYWTRGTNPPTWKPKPQQEARAMRAAGAKLSEICERFNIGLHSASRWCKGVKCPINHSAEALNRVRDLAAAGLRAKRAPPMTAEQYRYNEKLRKAGFSVAERRKARAALVQQAAA